ncbi:Ig-like domain repeat protein [Halogeometricum borinquense]|uniref:Ig-like domain repeat protein n=1 Tax=Halogeometricum borinquense TaxID=60847 RepID=A0A6C0UKE2_9EURY|nr:Ig-like domain repeat protein [Halogeometricum borinquense]QIB75717.1 Ig-like domain repeat protein [Halogeometricum borinquense]
MIRDRLEDARRPAIVAFALFATYLVVSTAPVAAAGTNLALGGEHDTASELSNGTLDGLTVEGSGESAYVTLGPTTYSDGFEDNDLSEWNVVLDDDTVETTSSSVISGSYSTRIYDANNEAGDTGMIYPETNTSNATISTKVNLNTDVDSDMVFLTLRGTFDSNGQIVDGVRMGIGERDDWVRIEVYENGSKVAETQYSYTFNNNQVYNLKFKAEGSTLTAYVDGSQVGQTQTTFTSSGKAGIFGGEADFIADDVEITNLDGGSGTYTSPVYSVSDPAEGRVDLSALSNANATVTWQADPENDGTWTDVTTSTYTSSGVKTADLSSVSADKWRVKVHFEKTGSNANAELDSDSIYFTNHDPVIDSSSASPQGGEETNNENVELSVPISDAEFGTAQGEEVTVDFYVDGNLIDTQTITSNQTVSTVAQDLADGNHTWHVETSDSHGGSAVSDTWNFTVNHYAADVDNSSMSPEDGAKLTSKDVTLSINASDRDFQLDGDTVTTEFVVDGEVVGTKNITSNGTVSTTISDVGGGNHSWYVRVYDEYGSGNSSNPDATSANKTYLVPSTLYIRPVNQPNELINGTNVTVTGRFFSGELVFERSTENGKLNLTDLPVDRTYVLVLEADGHNRRTVIITSLYEQDSVYLLNDSKTAYYTEFVLNDLTGEFSGSNERTKLYIERAVNTSSGLEWVTVSGDFFGAEGRFEATLEKDHRYRIRIVGEHNSSRVLGAYTATRKGTVTLNVGQVSWNVEDNTQAIRHSAAYIDLTDGNEEPNGVVHFQYHDPTQNTSKLRVIIHAANNSSNEIMNSTYTEGYGTFSLNKTVSGNLTETDWEVTWYAYNSSNAVIESSNDLADGKRYVIENPIGPKWTPVIVTCLFLFVGMLFGGRLSSIGSLAVTGVAAVMWWLGWYTASGGVVVFAGLVAVAMAVGGGGRR